VGKAARLSPAIITTIPGAVVIAMSSVSIIGVPGTLGLIIMVILVRPLLPTIASTVASRWLCTIPLWWHAIPAIISIGHTITTIIPILATTIASSMDRPPCIRGSLAVPSATDMVFRSPSRSAVTLLIPILVLFLLLLLLLLLLLAFLMTLHEVFESQNCALVPSIYSLLSMAPGVFCKFNEVLKRGVFREISVEDRITAAKIESVLNKCK